jgi:hypothetical protein
VVTGDVRNLTLATVQSRAGGRLLVSEGADFLSYYRVATYPSRKENDFIVIFVLQTFTQCLPTVKKWFKSATATSIE